MNDYKKIAKENAGKTFYLKEGSQQLQRFNSASLQSRKYAWEIGTPVGTIIGYDEKIGLLYTPSKQMEDTFWRASLISSFTDGMDILVVPKDKNMRGFYWTFIDDIIFGQSKKEIEELIKKLNL